MVRVAFVGCGRLGQAYLSCYTSAAFSDCELVGLVEANSPRLKAVGERFGVPSGQQFTSTKRMLATVEPEVVVVVTPAKYMHDTIMACTKAPSVKAIQCDKPLGAVLSEADEAVAACEASGIVFAGGNLQVAITQLQEAVAVGVKVI